MGVRSAAGLGRLGVLFVVVVLLVVVASGVAAAQEAEPNDERDGATSLRDGEEIEGDIGDEDDRDWYAVEVDSGESVSVTVTADGEGQNSVTLFRGGEAIDSADTTGGTVTLGRTVREDSTYYVLVEKQSFAEEGAEYTLSLRNRRTDDFEPNEDRESAVTLSPPERREGTVSAGDRDWYAVEAERGQTVNATVAVGAGGTNAVALYRGDTELARAEGSNETVSVGTTVRQTGTVYVAVSQGSFADQGADYTLAVSASRTDDFEPNEDRGNATALSGNATRAGTIAAGDTDWFSFEADRGVTVNATVDVAAGGTNDVRLFHNGTRIAQGEASGEPVSVGTTLRASGTYYLAVSQGSFADRGTDYTLSLSTRATDGFEPNEARANATNISLPATRAGTVSLNDADWFAFTASRGQTINVTGSVGPGGTNRVVVVGSDGPLASTDVSSGAVSLDATVPETGTYYLGLQRGPFADSGADYNLTVSTALTTAVSLSANRTTLTAGETTTVDLVVPDGTTLGPGTVSVAITTSDPGVVTVRDASTTAGTATVTDGSASFTLTDRNATGDTGRSVVGTIEVAAVESGSTTLGLSVTVGGDDGQASPARNRGSGVTLFVGVDATATSAQSTVATATATGATTRTASGAGATGTAGAAADGPATTGSGPGFGVVAALAGLLLVAVLAARRRG